MTKEEFIGTIAKDTGVSRKDIDKVVDSFLENTAKILKNKDTISFKGFGSFSLSQRSARTGRNPRTGEGIKIPATLVPKFTASKFLKDAINGKK